MHDGTPDGPGIVTHCPVTRVMSHTTICRARKQATLVWLAVCLLRRTTPAGPVQLTHTKEWGS